MPIIFPSYPHLMASQNVRAGSAAAEWGRSTAGRRPQPWQRWSPWGCVGYVAKRMKSLRKLGKSLGKAMQNCDWTMKNRIYSNHGLTIQNGDSITTKRYQKRFCWFSHPIKNMVLYNHQRRGNIVVESQFTIWIYLDELYELNSLKIAIIIRPWRGMVPIPNHLSYKVGPPEIAMLVNISKSSLGLC